MSEPRKRRSSSLSTRRPPHLISTATCRPSVSTVGSLSDFYASLSIPRPALLQDSLSRVSSLRELNNDERPITRRRSLSSVASISSTLSSSASHNSKSQEDQNGDEPRTNPFLALFAGKQLAQASSQPATSDSSMQRSTSFLPELSLPELSLPQLPNAPSFPSLPWKTWFNGSPQVSEQERAADNEMLEDKDKSQEGEPPWARIKANYKKPKNTIVFCHGLFGFDKIGVFAYWRGVGEALSAADVSHIITRVPASGSVKERAQALHDFLSEKMAGQEVNLVGHSQGGLDARYLASVIKPTTFKIRSITSIATPHRGSTFADYLLDDIVGRNNLPRILSLFSYFPGKGAAFEGLTTQAMEEFNAQVPDVPDIKYFSYGARCEPSIVDVFRLPWSIIYDVEGDNDGLVSVKSAKWGEYLGTIENVNHLDLIGWIGQFRFAYAAFRGQSIQFKPVSFYMSLSEMLAEQGF